MDLIRNRKINLVRLSPLYRATNITRHKKLLKFSGCDTEIELILARSACFGTPVNIQEMTVCPLHRECLGIGWRRPIRQCSVPEELSGHDGTAKQKAERGCTLLQSKLILEASEKFVPVGSGKQMFYVLWHVLELISRDRSEPVMGLKCRFYLARQTSQNTMRISET